MKAAQISKPGGDWELVERQIPQPDVGQVRVRVEACGVCHSNMFVKEGFWPGIQYPRVPGHEVAGRIDALGTDVTGWENGQRVGVGWHGGHCFQCEQCRRGDFAMCINRKVTGIDFDGGYAEYMIAPAAALAAIPDELPAEEAGPFMCAGVTVFNALRNSGAQVGDVVAVHGIGGLGHLGVQYARQMGFETVALGRGRDKEPLNVSVMPLIAGRRSVAGWYSGTARDSQDTLEFSALSGVHPMIEKYPLNRVAEAYKQMHSGKARFRAVLKM
jgi:D-arabinose 1-dehydrogenase-like Zn-dependent alcohol dehydrogenase